MTALQIGEVPVNLEDPTSSASPGPAPIIVPGTPPDGVYLWPFSVAVAPGGRTAYVAVERSEVRNDNWSGETLEWIVQIRPDGASSARPLPDELRLAPGSWCPSSAVFIDEYMLAEVCADPTRPSTPLHVRRINADGSRLVDIPIDQPGFDGGWPISVVIDRSSAAVFIWQLVRHALVRVDLGDGTIAETTVADALLPDTRPSAGRGRGYVGGDPGLVMSPDGKRLFAIGVAGELESEAFTPSGIWVFDAMTLRLVDNWEPRAFLSSIAVSDDGRFVYAAGAAGLDVTGRANSWPASVTVYDAATGEVEVVYGAVTRDANTWLSFYSQP